MSRRSSDGARWAIVALVLAGLALRCFRLSDADIWWDEALAVWATRQGFLEATRWTAGDVHPPLFFWSLWLWLRLVGDDAFALRLLVVFTGVLLTALAWPLGRRLSGTAGGVLAVTAVATSRFLTWWSMELRMYALAGACVLVATVGAVGWLEGRARGRRRSRRCLAMYVLGATGALYSVYLAGAGLAAVNVVVGWRLLGRRPKALTPRPPPGTHRAESAAGIPLRSPGEREDAWRRAVEWAAAQVAVLVAFAPWALYAGGRMSSWRVIEEGPSLWFTIKLWLTLLATGGSTNIDAAWPWAASLALAVVIAWTLAILPQNVRRGPRRAFSAVGSGRASGGEGLGPSILLLPLLLIPPLSIWAITQPRSLFYSPNVEARYFAPFAAPALVITAAVIARAATKRRAAWVLAALLLAPSLVHLPAYYAPRRATDTLPTMALAIWSQSEPGDVVVLVSGNRYPLWLYHYDRAWVQPLGKPRYELPADDPAKWPERPPVVLFPDRGSETLAGHDDWQAKLDGIVDAHPRVWLVEYGRDLQDPGDEVEAWLAERLALVLSEGYGADALHLFARDDREPVVRALSARWPGAELIQGDHSTSGSRTVDVFALVFGSATRAFPGETVNVTLFPTHNVRTQDAAMPGEAVVSDCRMKVVSIIGIEPEDRIVDWTMSAAADISGSRPTQRLRASLSIGADSPREHQRVYAGGCGDARGRAWALDVLDRP